MREQWDRWGWVVALVVIAIGFLRLVWGREAFCEPNEHCLREWISALGGWVAVAVAVPTIIFLSKQVRDAEKHHRTTIGIQARPTYMLAKRAAETSVNIRNQIAEKGELWAINNLPADHEFKKQAVERLRFLRDLIDRTEFIRIQSEIEVTYMRHEQLLNAVDESIDKLKESLRHPRFDDFSPSEAVIGCSANAVQYLGQVKDVCDRFISDFERMTDHLR
ncbi:hypothetical protein ELH26_09130 [Rhizobium leguminosarum]|uniref:hypothetical protein n=1 Tax=Rhizobium leguminosarum TaxID=384 RepID=UPI00102FF9D4|nr:hypothetical protein [Rhizobium leguminosarum]TBC94164.1 hypothetical protein ELH26_09130 [Rhizobium leguminosarum]